MNDQVTGKRTTTHLPAELTIHLHDHAGEDLGHWRLPAGSGWWVSEDGDLLSLDEVQAQVLALVKERTHGE